MMAGTRRPRPPPCMVRTLSPSPSSVLPLFLANTVVILFETLPPIGIASHVVGIRCGLGMSSDESEVSSDGLVADSASEVSDNGSEGSVSSSEQQLEEQEEAHIKKQAKESEEQEFSDPEYGYNSEDSENEVRTSN